ncbi:hypothetical protein KAI68_08240 [bacterium]|nr:hypothetical protein [bacterium]
MDSNYFDVFAESSFSCLTRASVVSNLYSLPEIFVVSFTMGIPFGC